MTEGTIEIDDGVYLFYRAIGRGSETVVVLLAAHRRYIFYDLRNRGRSVPITDRARLARGIDLGPRPSASYGPHLSNNDDTVREVFARLRSLESDRAALTPEQFCERLLSLDGAGHAPWIEYPSTVFDAARVFLDDHVWPANCETVTELDLPNG